MHYSSDLPFPVASIEFDKVYLVMDKRIALGYTDRELSFLLGYRSLYVRDVEDPLHTLRYTPKDTNYLLHIFDCKLPEIMSPKITELFYQIKVAVTIKDDGSKVYEISRELKNKEYVQYRTLKTGVNNILSVSETAGADQIRYYIDLLFETSYFETPRTALEIFKKSVKEFESRVQPQYLHNALSFYTGKRKAPRLIKRKNESSRTVYLKEDILH